MKRFLDISVALSLIILFIPALVIIPVMIKRRMGGPIFFKQLRPGLREKPFYLYKFRTMNSQTDDKGALLPDKYRLTNYGRFLRKYSLDELPQLFNVVKGDMSLVGPRPLLMEYLPLYNENQSSRHNVKPGITGWAQINGRNAITWEEKFKLDIWYVRNQSVFLDLKILLITVVKVLKKEGIHQQQFGKSVKFTGSKEVV